MDDTPAYPIAMLPGYDPGMVTVMVGGAADLIETLMGSLFDHPDSSAVRSVCAALREIAQDVV